MAKKDEKPKDGKNDLIECLIAADGKLADTPEETLATIDLLRGKSVLGGLEAAALKDQIRTIQKQVGLKSQTHGALQKIYGKLEQTTAYMLGAEANPQEESLQKVITYGTEVIEDYLKNRYRIVGGYEE